MKVELIDNKKVRRVDLIKKRMKLDVYKKRVGNGEKLLVRRRKKIER